MKFKVKPRKKELDKLCRKIILKTQEGYCQWCGDTGKVRVLHIHHIIPKSRGNSCRWDLDNLVILCSVCHLFRMKDHTVEYGRFIEKWLNDRDLNYDQLRDTYAGSYLKFTKEYFEVKKKVLNDILESF